MATAPKKTRSTFTAGPSSLRFQVWSVWDEVSAAYVIWKTTLTRLLLHFALHYKFSGQLFYFLPVLFACRFRDIRGYTDNQGEPLSRHSHFKMPRPFLQSQAIQCGSITLIEFHQPLHLKSWNPCATMRSGILQREETRLLNWAAEAKHLAARWQEGTKVFRWCLERRSLTKADTSLSVTGFLFSSRKMRECTFDWCVSLKRILSSERRKNHI